MLCLFLFGDAFAGSHTALYQRERLLMYLETFGVVEEVMFKKFKHPNILNISNNFILKPLDVCLLAQINALGLFNHSMATVSTLMHRAAGWSA